MKTIVFTGGGSAGHVTPNISLFPDLQKKSWNIVYIGSQNGIEKELIEKIQIPYFAISSGKLRRYLSLENLIDPFKVLWGIVQAFFLIRKIKPSLVFSKGGFVSVPVIIAAYINKVPVIAHESDFTPGLATKLSARFAQKICTSFPETLKYLPSNKSIHTGSPIREDILTGNKDIFLKTCDFPNKKPVLMSVGGSLGSGFLNNSLREILPELLKEFNVIHLCGKDNIDSSLVDLEGYKQFEFLSNDMPDALACADIVISRAGSNAIFELLALNKPHLLIPLSKKASRGDQILNAKSFEKMGFSLVIQEEEVKPDSLLQLIKKLYTEREKFSQKMQSFSQKSGKNEILNLINDYS